MHPMTRAVAKLADRLEFEQFRFPEAREDINAIRALALDQINDDMDRQRQDRIGRTYVEHVGQEYDGGVLYGGRWTAQQQALEQAMIPFLDRLTAKQREALHLLFWGRLTERQAALVLGISRVALRERRDSALAALHQGLKGAFVEDDK